jgi:hypothetical protein
MVTLPLLHDYLIPDHLHDLSLGSHVIQADGLAGGTGGGGGECHENGCVARASGEAAIAVITVPRACESDWAGHL